MSALLSELSWAALSKFHYYLSDTYTFKVFVIANDLFSQLWIYFTIGIIATTLISILWHKSKIAEFFQKSSRISIIMAAVVGVISPIPTYVAIPLVAALFRVGVPAAPLFAFLMASPLMNPILFSLTAGAFGAEMAIARLLSALVLGIASGAIMQKLVFHRRFNGFLNGGASLVGISGDLETTDRNIKAYTREFADHFYRLTRFASKYFLLGIIIAAMVKALIPADWIINMLGNQRIISVLTAVAAGVPLYACGGGTIPVMQTLQELGMDKGAILAFFISGPATKLSTLVALKAVIVKGVFIIYLIIAFIGASILGLIFSIW
jgi:uncharacterized membrane protein YraQ (UPF0718 family)